jgi:hypothetical protein
MATATFTAAQPLTVVMVFKTGTGGPNNNTGGMSAFAILLDGDITQAAATRMIMFAGRTDTTPANRATYYAGTGSGVDTTVIFAASTAYHYAAIFNGASSSSDINGTTTTGNAGTGGVVNGILVGDNPTGNAIDAYVCEIIGIPDTTHLAQVLAYVSAKWGV